MKRWLAAVLLSLLPFSLAAQEQAGKEKPEQLPKLPMISLPAASGAYVDPVTGNRVWRVTDRGLCARGAIHFYSYWPVWNQDGTYFIVECQGWMGSQGSTALLVRDKDLKVMGDALKGAPGFTKGRLFWSWKDSQYFYGFRDTDVWKWNPFQGKGARIFDLDKIKVGDSVVESLVLVYVSFDDRYLLIELHGPNRRHEKPRPRDTLGLLCYDMQTQKIVGMLDVTAWKFFDEAVFTKDNFVWVRMTDDTGTQLSLRYSLDFSQRIRVSEGGHYAHGILPSGAPVAVRAASNRECPPGSPSGNPSDEGYPAKGWKPTAIILDERVDTTYRADGTLTGRNDPLQSELFKLGCNIPGQHRFDHFSWNNVQHDQFFISTSAYTNPALDPLANAILRMRLQFDATGKVIADNIDVLVQHRSSGSDYWASPRASCNQQGTRCLFASSMSVATDNPRPGHDLYIVEVPPAPAATEP